MTEIRCKKCNRLLMKGVVSLVEIKCPKCGYLQRVVSAFEFDAYKENAERLGRKSDNIVSA